MNLFSIKGRIGRLKYFLIVLICTIIVQFTQALITGTYDESILLVVAVVVINIVCIWVVVCTATKRCHDVGHNGWWQLIPFYGLWLLFEAGEPEENEYGNQP